MAQRAPAIHRGEEAEEERGAERVERVTAREERGAGRADPGRRRTRLTVPVSERRGRPSRAGSASAPESAASGSTVKIGLSAKIGPTIEMSPRALARARSPLIPITSTAQTATAGQAASGGANAWPVTRKKTTQLAAAIACVQATITSGGIARARPLTTANCAAWVSAAPNDSANQFTRGAPARGASASPRAHAPGRRRYKTSEVSDITASPVWFRTRPPILTTPISRRCATRPSPRPRSRRTARRPGGRA